MSFETLTDALPILIAGVGLAALLSIWRLMGKIHSYFYTETNGEGSTKTVLKGINEGIRDNTRALEKHHEWSQRQLRDIRRRLPPPS